MYNYSKYGNSILKDEIVCDDIKNFIINCMEGKNETDESIFVHEFNRMQKFLHFLIKKMNIKYQIIHSLTN